jgi:hypothetical protein
MGNRFNRVLFGNDNSVNDGNIRGGSMMIGKKVVVNIKIEVLSVDVVTSILMDVMEQFHKEHYTGTFTADDGDTVQWSTNSINVEF